MRREHKTYFLLVAVISFIIPVASVFIGYSIRTEANLPTTDLCFEGPDQDSSSAGDRNESKTFGFTTSPDALLLEGNLLHKVLSPFSQTPSFDQKTTMLRC